MTEPGRPFDVVVVGAGPGGYYAALHAAELGAHTALVERDLVGGTCLNRGCIPSKVLLELAHLAERIRDAPRRGLNAELRGIDAARAWAEKDRVVARLREGARAGAESRGVELFAAEARLEASGRVGLVEAGGRRSSLQARTVILATGSQPARLPMADGLGILCLDSDRALEVAEIPSRLLVVGAGAVGVELAQVYAGLGSRVVLLEALPRIVPTEDAELSALLAQVLDHQGIVVRTGTRLLRLEAASGGVVATVQAGEGSGAAPERFEADRVLVAVGRRPASETLGLDSARVATEGGFVRVDAQLRTSLPGVFAIGDLVGAPLLAHKASAEGVAAVDVALGRPVHLNRRAIPRCVYTWPELAAVGLTQAEAEAAGYRVKVGRLPAGASSRAATLGDARPAGLLKVVSDAGTGELLGVHALMGLASEVIAEAALAISLEATVDDLRGLVHPHPTVSEALGEAAGAALLGSLRAGSQ